MKGMNFGEEVLKLSLSGKKWFKMYQENVYRSSGGGGGVLEQPFYNKKARDYKKPT
jgi:hypothetical protein